LNISLKNVIKFFFNNTKIIVVWKIINDHFFFIINEGATCPFSIGWAQLETRKIGRYGDGPEVVRKYLFRSGIHCQVKKIVFGMMAKKAGFGPIHLAHPDLILSVSIVSIILLVTHSHSCFLNNIPEKIF